MNATTKDWAVWMPAADGVFPVAGGSYTKVRWDRTGLFESKQAALDEAVRTGTFASGPLRGLAPVVRTAHSEPSNTFN